MNLGLSDKAMLILFRFQEHSLGMYKAYLEYVSQVGRHTVSCRFTVSLALDNSLRGWVVHKNISGMFIVLIHVNSLAGI